MLTELEVRFLEEVLEDSYEEIVQLDEGNTTGVLERIREGLEMLNAPHTKGIYDDSLVDS